MIRPTIRQGLLAASLVAAVAPRARATPLAEAAPATVSDGVTTATVDVNAKAGVVRRRGPGGAEERLPLALRAGDQLDASAISITTVAIGHARSVAHVRVGLANTADRAYEAIVPATGAPVFLGPTGWVTGQEGERTGEVIQIVRRDDGSSVVTIAEVREDRRLCGQRFTALAPRGLDASTMLLRGATLQRLDAAERARARTIVAIARGKDVAAPLARALRADFASSGDAARVSDGDLTTAWREERPSDGRGEFVVMRAPPEVAIERLFVVPSPSARSPFAAPRTFFLLAGGATFRVTLPEDAAMHPGDHYEIPLPEPARGGCVAIVLDEAYGAGAHPEVAVAELLAHTEHDRPGATIEGVVRSLGGGGPRAESAAALLQRADPVAVVPALERSWAGLDAPGRGLAIAVASGMPGCAEAAPIFVRALADRDLAVSNKARGRLERCGAKSGPALVGAVQGADLDMRRRAAPVLALVAPSAALEPLLAALGDGDAETRRSTRGAFALAARSAPAERIAAMLEATTDDARRAELLRAARARLADLRGPAERSLAPLVSSERPMATRYLLLEPIAALAEPGTWSHGALLSSLRSAPEWPIRARAAELAAARPSLVDALVLAGEDPEPRVREAAMRSLAELGSPRAAPTLLARLEDDPWTFVAVAAAAALARTPPDAAIDLRLAKLLDDPRPRAQSDALHVLGVHRALPVRRAVEIVGDKARDPDVRRRAVVALGAACAADAVGELTSRARALAVPMPMEIDLALGIAAIEALGRIHPRDLADRLAPLLARGSRGEAARLAERAIAEPGACP